MQSLHPKSVWLFFFSYLFKLFFFFLIIGFWLGGMITALSKAAELPGTSSVIFFVFIFLVFFIGLSYIWAKLSYKYYRYELAENGFKKEMGVIYKKYVTIPYERIQNVDIYRGILARILGLSDVNIQTAGASAQVSRSGVYGAGAEGRLPGLLHEDAIKLRDELIARARKPGNQGL